MYAAYEALSSPLRLLLDGLVAVHDLSKMLVPSKTRGQITVDLDQALSAWPPSVHPVVRVNPKSGRKGLFVNGNWTVRIQDMSERESEMILAFLFEHAASPEFQCRFRWTEHSVVVIDNRFVQHYAVPDYNSRRIMHRVYVAGTQPLGSPHALSQTCVT